MPAISASAHAAVAASAPATLAFELPAQTGIIEGLAFRPSTGEFFFGDVHHRCVWRRDRTGNLTRFSPPGDVLYGVFGLAIDGRRQLLWAATSLLPETAGFARADKGRCALVALDLSSGQLTHRFPLAPDARDHVLGDLLLAPDGTVYVTDSAAPVVWFVAPGSDHLAPFVESASFRSLQGLALVAGGRKLLVSDYAHGLFVIDLATREVHALAAPSGTDLRGLDGLVASDNAIFSVYNARDPNTVLRLTLSPDADAVTGMERISPSAPEFADLTLITRADGRPHVIANSGWSLAHPDRSPDVPAHAVRIFSLP
ncbi:MAG TPA: hypothetical protein VHE13_04330 [Opitutus sp.]|nr:hypothetical protein [Opitutus sp.]